MLTTDQRTKLVHAVTRYDAKLEAAAARAKRHHSIYALGLYLAAIDGVAKMKGTPRECLRRKMHGRLLDVCLRALGEPLATKEEVRGDYNAMPF